MRETLVSIVDVGKAGYPAPPYSPDAAYPEYRGGALNGSPNRVYAGVRELLRQLGLDAARFNTPEWNPLGTFIRAGARVLVKPNLVRHYHPRGLDPLCIVTHASLVRALCDYALLAAGSSGEIVIADAPLQTCDFAEVIRLAGLDHLERYYRERQAKVALRDLRLVRAELARAGLYGKVLVQRQGPGDPSGYTVVDLGPASLHAGRPADPERYRVTCYDPARMVRHHGGDRHEYVVANTLIEADAVLNLPKMKTHQKAGITGAMKNFIGVNGHKDCLPHHVAGAAESGGDEYPHTSRMKALDSWMMERQEAGRGLLLKKSAAAAHRLLFPLHMRGPGNGYWAGSWYGNDTISRTTVDLNRIVRYAGAGGKLDAGTRRPVLTIVDGILAGDRDGPLAPTPKPAGLLLGGFNVVAADMVMARLMGFDYRRIPTLAHALGARGEFPLVSFGGSDVETVSNQPRWSGLALDCPGESLSFEAHQGWRGHIEL